jgi:hypothetical protein
MLTSSSYAGLVHILKIFLNKSQSWNINNVFANTTLQLFLFLFFYFLIFRHMRKKSHNLLFSRTAYVIENLSSVLYTVLLHDTVDKWFFVYKTFFVIFTTTHTLRKCCKWTTSVQQETFLTCNDLMCMRNNTQLGKHIRFPCT